MTKNDAMHEKARLWRADLAAAFGLLSRLPVGGAVQNGRELARGAWAWPVVGAVLGGLAGLVALAALGLGVPAAVAAGLALAAQVLLTGGLHEDGLADSADGLWGGASPARRLEIMRDSRVGSYGVLALVLGMGLRWAALAALFQAGWVLAPLVAVGAVSRAAMALLMARLPAARADGLAAGAGTVAPRTALAALALGLGLALICVGGASLWAAVWAGVAVAVLASAARTRIGGQTGDILGAGQQLAEMAALVALSAAIG